MFRLYRPLSLLFLLFMSQSIFADIVYLQNGDRISGKITSMLKSELKLATSYSEITIPWADIKDITSDQTIVIELNDGSQLNGLLTKTEQGASVQTTTLAKAIPVTLNDISAINPPIISDKAIVTGGVHIGGSKSSGNTEKQAFNADANIEARSGNNKFSAGAAYHQAANTGKESENNFNIFLQYDHYFLPEYYVSLFTIFDKDRFQDLNFRSAFGASLGHEFWNTDINYLSAEAGVAYTIEDYGEGTDREFIAGKWAIDFNYWLLKDRLQFFHKHNGLISFQDFSDVLVKTSTGFKFPVYEGFELLTQFDFDYDAVPAENKKSTDTRYIIGAGYSW